MAKIDPFYDLKKKFANHQHFFQPLLNEDYQKEGEPFTLIQFENQLKKGDIVFYPSSGSDINDVIYLNSNLVQLSHLKSNVYFHCDYLNTNISMIENSLTQKSYQIKAKFLYKNEDTFRFIKIYKLKYEQSKKLIWFVYFSGYYNEEIIDFSISSNLKTKIVYSYCDGITSDRMNCNPYPIPTIFFPFMVEELGIESIITEQDAKYITEVISNGNSRDIQNWLHKVNAVAPNSLTATLLEIKDPTVLRNKIIEALTRFEEHSIDEIEHPKLVIKKIS
jgi:hypothetical protein